MTQDEYNEAAALVVRLRKELEHTNQHLVAHIDALTKSNAQCAEYLRQNEQLHSELVDVRAALALVAEQRDSLKRTLDEWERADTKPHVRVSADDIADHVMPPVLPPCMTCHGCGCVLEDAGAKLLCPCPDCDFYGTKDNLSE
jgi:septal ring factor EnvC (AmiA/AmiB activator)